MSEEERKEEIIIIKRYGDGGDGHHGGAWKIAFADFMTAMMALFLVLWLVNASNEEIKKSVASYFNPVKLVERNRSKKGLDSTSEPWMEESEDDEQEEAEKKPPPPPAPEAGAITDTALFKDPFKVLEKIAETTEQQLGSSDFFAEATQEAGAPEEDAFLDPFAQPEAIGDSSDFDGDGDRNATADNPATGPDDDAEANKVEIEELALAEKTTSPATDKEPDPGEQAQDANPISEAQLAAKMAQKEEEQTEKRQEMLGKLSDEIVREINQALKQTLGDEEQISDSLSVEVTKDGVLISITDQFGFSMFRSGSAVPQGELVLAMQEISNVLADKPGMVRIYGHTDAKPYNGKNYDNWRLSTARAHSARLMLARGGLKPLRVSQVVGFADRKLRTPESPEDEANRRIEILLEVS